MKTFFKGFRGFSKEQYKELASKGELYIDGEHIVYDDDYLYLTPDKTTLNVELYKDLVDKNTEDIAVLTNKSNVIEETLNALSQTTVTIDTPQTITAPKTFVEHIYLANVDGSVDRLSHINNNFIIHSGATNSAVLNIDEGLSKIYAFNKELAFKEDVTGGTGDIGDLAVLTAKTHKPLVYSKSSDGSGIINYNPDLGNDEYTYDPKNTENTTLPIFLNELDGAIIVEQHNAVVNQLVLLDERVTNNAGYNNVKFSDNDKAHSNMQTQIDALSSGIEKVETFYDMSDSDKNLGYVNGLAGGTTISTPSFSKYKMIRVYGNYKTRNQLFAVVNLTKSNEEGNYVGANMQPTFEGNDTDAVWMGCAVTSGKGQFAVTFGNFSTTKVIDNANGYVYKIEGVY